MKGSPIEHIGAVKKIFFAYSAKKLRKICILLEGEAE